MWIPFVGRCATLGKHRDAMRSNIAADLGIGIDQVNIKATTSEGLVLSAGRRLVSCHRLD
jgi:2C-methyl-D-erythritol 2,4-cyclodiphosphate synthase